MSILAGIILFSLGVSAFLAEFGSANYYDDIDESEE